jgi:adenine-specific DNA methylase
MQDGSRLIEHAFPLKQTSLDSVHEKNVRHGHISTLHIWPARRPLAACRAALIATLLPDPGGADRPADMSDEAWHAEVLRRRRELCEMIGGTVVRTSERKKMPNGETVEREKEQTEGGILHWGREEENEETLQWFRDEIRKAYGGRPPRVLDPFAGGGAIPLEAMRLGCEAIAGDINPVAWFVLKCTLDYPQRMAGKEHPLPEFILEDEEFMDAFYAAHPRLVGTTKKTSRQIREDEATFPEWRSEDTGRTPMADLAWHVRAWGRWVLDHARRDLARYYPTYAEFEAVDRKHAKDFEQRPLTLVPIASDGSIDANNLNAGFSKEYLSDITNPRWVAKPTVAYLWARTVTCKNCRAALPLLKTQWLARKEKKRVLLTMEPSPRKDRVVFGINENVPARGGNAAQKREHDRKIAAGTMSRSGARCPCCGTIMTMEDIRFEGKAGRLGSVMTAVVIDGPKGKEYRLPTEHEIETAADAEKAVAGVFAQIPFGLPEEPTPKGGSGASRAFSVDGYGFDRWSKLFTPRQLLALGTFVKWTRAVDGQSGTIETNKQLHGAISFMLGCVLDRAVNYMSTVCIWESVASEIKQTFLRFALPITWDFAEANPLSNSDRFYRGGITNVAEYLERNESFAFSTPEVTIRSGSALLIKDEKIDLIVTDPPYYDAIPYSDLMDFFYVWIKRTMMDRDFECDKILHGYLSPKWDVKQNDGELIDDSSRHGGDRAVSKSVYEEGMSKAFASCNTALAADGRMVIVFAHKQPDAWETLVASIIKSGFTVVGSWPIVTEMRGGVRNYGRASLASSVWLVCRKRPAEAQPGWDNIVLGNMRRNINERLREFWDAGIRGPDFVWAATGPALEAYSRHPVVKKANEPGPLGVGEFLGHVRRMVVDFVVGRVLTGDREADAAAMDRLDEPTAYYLLHRHDFGMHDAPAGACILYAISCGLSDKQLADAWDIIVFTRGKDGDDAGDDEDAEQDVEVEEVSGGKVRLKSWTHRTGKMLGFEAPGGRPVPLIDRVHCLMHLWKAGDLVKVDDYLDANGLRRHELFRRLVQSLIELATPAGEERSLLESLSNHVHARGAIAAPGLPFASSGSEETQDG